MTEQGAYRSEPARIEQALFSYWAELENWTRLEWESAVDAFEDKYSVLLPHVQFESYLRPSDLMAVAKSVRPSSPGVDGWTHRGLSLSYLLKHGMIQHALVGGVLNACSNLAFLALQELWGLSVDFAKIFNTLSPHIASMVARTVGLSLSNIRDVALPIINARAVWRSPANYPPEVFTNSREFTWFTTRHGFQCSPSGVSDVSCVVASYKA